MKIVFTIHSPIELAFTADVNDDTDAWKILRVLGEGQPFPVSHVVIRTMCVEVPSVLQRQAE